MAAYMQRPHEYYGLEEHERTAVIVPDQRQGARGGCTYGLQTVFTRPLTIPTNPGRSTRAFRRTRPAITKRGVSRGIRRVACSASHIVMRRYGSTCTNDPVRERVASFPGSATHQDSHGLQIASEFAHHINTTSSFKNIPLSRT